MGFEFMLQLKNGKVLYGKAKSVNDYHNQIVIAEITYNSKVVDKKPNVESEAFKWIKEVAKHPYTCEITGLEVDRPCSECVVYKQLDSNCRWRTGKETI